MTQVSQVLALGATIVNLRSLNFLGVSRFWFDKATLSGHFDIYGILDTTTGNAGQNAVPLGGVDVSPGQIEVPPDIQNALQGWPALLVVAPGTATFLVEGNAASSTSTNQSVTAPVGTAFSALMTVSSYSSAGVRIMASKSMTAADQFNVYGTNDLTTVPTVTGTNGAQLLGNLYGSSGTSPTPGASMLVAGWAAVFFQRDPSASGSTAGTIQGCGVVAPTSAGNTYWLLGGNAIGGTVVGGSTDNSDVRVQSGTGVLALTGASVTSTASGTASADVTRTATSAGTGVGDTLITGNGAGGATALTTVASTGGAVSAATSATSGASTAIASVTASGVTGASVATSATTTGGSATADRSASGVGSTSANTTATASGGPAATNGTATGTTGTTTADRAATASAGAASANTTVTASGIATSATSAVGGVGTDVTLAANVAGNATAGAAVTLATTPGAGVLQLKVGGPPVAQFELLPGVAANSGPTAMPVGLGGGQAGRYLLQELLANGTNVTGWQAPDILAADVVYTLPAAVASITGQSLRASAVASTLVWGGAVNVSATNANGQTVTNNAAATNVLTWTEVTDTANAFNPATGVFTVPAGAGGFYVITLALQFAATAVSLGAEYQAIINKSNGTLFVGSLVAAVAVITQKRQVMVTMCVALAVGDTIWPQVLLSGAGGNVALTADATTNLLGITQISG